MLSADVDPASRLQAAQEEARAQQQQGADGHLRDNQPVTKAEPVAGGVAARVSLQVRDQIRSRGPQGRHEPEDDARRD